MPSWARSPRRRWSWLAGALVAAFVAAWLLAPIFLRESNAPLDAVEAARRTLKQQESRSGSAADPAVADALDAIVVALYAAGRATAEETIEHARRAVTVKRTVFGPDDLELAESLSNLGAVLFERAEFQDARDVFAESLRIRRAHPEERLALQESLHNLALTTKETGDLAAARVLFEESIALLADDVPARGDLLVRRTRAWNDYGLLLHELGDYRAAEQAFATARVHARGDRAELANVLHSLGRLHHDTKDYRAAKECFDEAMAIVAELPVVLPRWKAALLNNFGWLHHETGDLAAARALYDDALRLREAAGEHNPHTAWTLSNLALLDLSAGRFAEAGMRLERALKLRRRSFAPEHPLLFHSLSYLALLDLVRGATREGLDRALAAEEIRRKGLLLVLPVLEARRGLLLRSLEVFGLDSSSLDLALSCLASSATADATAAAAVWDAVVRSRGLVLEELAERGRLRAVARDPETAALVEDLARARQRLANLFAGSGAPGALETAGRAVEAAEFALARRYRAFRPQRGRAHLGWSDVGAALARQPPGTVLLAYVKYARFAAMEAGTARVEPAYLAFVCESGGNRPRYASLGRAGEVESLVERWRAEVLAGAGADPAADLPQAAGAELRRAVWDPLLAGIGAARRVFIVAEGALHGVSFAALPAAGGAYLVEDGPLIHYLSTEKELVSFSARPSAPVSRGTGLLALGADARGDLPSTVDEARTVAAIVAEARRVSAQPDAVAGSAAALVLTGPDATEEAFKRHAPGRRIIHVASHGFFLDNANDIARHALRERFRGLKVSVAGGDAELHRTENPLLLSGLAFAAAPGDAAGDAASGGRAASAAEDGILLAEEIVALELDGVEWTVLSACETGLGRVQSGEGILGLQRAFRLAGAESLIFSLWRVEDEATKDWMVELYRARFEDRLDTAECVRRASLRSIARRRAAGRSSAPFYWAGFVSAGDWR